MNKVFLATFFLCGLASADQTQETFLKAAAYYQKGQIAHALELYNKIQAPYPSVFYNSGVCYYALEKYPEALVAFRKAERWGNKSLYKKASHAIAATQKIVGVTEYAFLFRVCVMVHAMLPGDVIRFLFLALLACFSLMIVMRRFSSWLRALGCVVLMMGIWCCFEYWFLKQQYGIVLSKNAQLYAGPDKQFHKVSEISAGQQVKVVEQDQSWYKVYFPVGQGWIEQADLGLF